MMASSAPELKWAGLLIKSQIKPILGWAILRDNDIIGVLGTTNWLQVWRHAVETHV